MLWYMQILHAVLATEKCNQLLFSCLIYSIFWNKRHHTWPNGNLGAKIYILQTLPIPEFLLKIRFLALAKSLAADRYSEEIYTVFDNCWLNNKP